MKLRPNCTYRLETSVTFIGDSHPYPDKPYFWWIKEVSDTGSECNTGCCGWGETPLKAMVEGWETWQQWLSYD